MLCFCACLWRTPLDQFTSDAHVRLGPDRCDVVQDDWLSETRSLSQTDVPGDDTLKDLRSKIFSSVGCYLPRKIQARVVHGQENAVNSERGVQSLLYEMDGVEQLG